jgi:hypothetical protein
MTRESQAKRMYEMDTEYTEYTDHTARTDKNDSMLFGIE